MLSQITGITVTNLLWRVTVDNITKQYRLHQVIIEPIHILDSISSCIDLIFTSQPNLITESGVHPSLHPNCHQLYMLISTYKFISLHLIYEKFGVTKAPIMSLNIERLANLTDKEPF